MGNRIAVVVSTYNARETLARVLQAYARQSRLPDELLVADDGSGDGTDEMVREFARSAGFPVRYIWQEDDGFRLARIRNLAVKACECDYVVFTDGDCLPHPRFVEDHLRVREAGWFAQGKRMLVGKALSSSFGVSGTARLILHCARGEISGIHHLIRVPGLYRPKQGLRGIKTANFAIHKDDFVAVNGFNEEFTGWGREDSELVVRLYKYGLRRRDIPLSAIVFHLWHPEATRESLPENDRLLAAAVESSDYRCQRGIEDRTGLAI